MIKFLLSIQFRVFLLFFISVALIFVIATRIISVRFDIFPHFTAKMLVRKGMLKSIEALTLIYDPTETKSASLGAKDEDQVFNLKDFIRMDDFLSNVTFQNRYKIEEIHNEEIVKSKFYFSYQPYEEPRLDKLKNKYHLEQVVDSATNDFEAMVLLRNWARSQFRRNDFQPLMVNFDALKILDDKARNSQKKYSNPHLYFDPCHFFPLFYSQLLLSLGYQSRLVRISHTGYSGHGMVEVWSNHYAKWIAIDAELNLHYEKNGIPLNLLEIHNERYNQEPSPIKIIRGSQHSGDDSTTLVFLGVKNLDIRKMIDYHSYFQIVDMRNDWMTNHYFQGHPKRSDQSSLVWVDKKLKPILSFKPSTSDIGDFYWTLNQTEIWIKKNNDPTLQLPLAFKTFTPNFNHFEILIDDSEKSISTDSAFTWKLHRGDNKLFISSVNKFGIHGIPSYVELFVNIENSK